MHFSSPRLLRSIRFIPVLLLGLAAFGIPSRAFDPDSFDSSFNNGNGGAARQGGIRVVSCDDVVRSAKRGVCMNEMSQADFEALSQGVSWYYNWNYDTKYRGESGSMQFIPMMWGNRPDALRALDSYLASANPKPPVVLAVNEPNLKGQAFITPRITADVYRETKEIADRYNIPVVGPNMALGSAGGDSITAPDPVENKTMTYTFMVPFIKATLFYLQQQNITPPALAVHSYGGAGEVKWCVDMMHKTFNCPIWVTEYAQWKTSDPEEARRNLIETTDFLERTPYVAGYAWFKDRANNNPSISLLEPESGKLSPLGEAYVSLPAHDASLYYRIPGRLQAADYVTAEDANIRPTADTNGPYQMAADSAGATIDYNIQVDAPGTYTLAFRVAGSAGKIDVLKAGQVIASANAPEGNDWHTVQSAVPLIAGLQKIQVRYGASGLCLHWIEFGR
jgi:hypothetical protein